MSVIDHAPFGPSGMHQLIQCPGSWKMQQLHPRSANISDEEAKEGEAGHWVCAEMSAGREPKRGDLAPNGVLVTDEMLEGADLWISTVGTSPTMHVEERLPPSPEIDPDNWGTPDRWDFLQNELLIDVADYKFGRRFVDVFENWQLMNYALLIIDAVLQLDGMQDQHVKVRFRIVQPRSYHPEGPVREWICRASDLRGARNQIRAACEQARGPNPVTRVGHACRDCSARAYCGTLARATEDALTEVGRVTPLNLEASGIGTELRFIGRAIEVLQARRSGLSEVALASVRQGVAIPGFRAQQGQGRQVWKVPVEQVAALGAMMEKTLTQQEPITPKQAIKLGIDAAIVESFTEIRHGEIKLVEDDGSLTRRMFGSSI